MLLTLFLVIELLEGMIKKENWDKAVEIKRMYPEYSWSDVFEIAKKEAKYSKN
jgi:hypothetical protein